MRQESYEEKERRELEAAYRSACIGMLRLVIQDGVRKHEGEAILDKYNDISGSFANKFKTLYLALCAKESKLRATADQGSAMNRLAEAISSCDPDSVINNPNPDYFATSGAHSSYFRQSKRLPVKESCQDDNSLNFK